MIVFDSEEKLEGLDFSEGLRNISLTSNVFDVDYFKKMYIRSTWETLYSSVQFYKLFHQQRS